ncbi:hypothetical protein [Ancylomarina sp. 16SWW S1-10-2]|uniref:hypothetical protein n=1 Tax=Ancylomarina sp. 16SWW S1-10-2 TaxID=2499681 RepID=UPI0012ADDD35|nr:hypothetical protein [Ancylomarina sp. 16SWW S1-10-2]MRT94201.1 hypothetical protein [Ancylomarina sp. 16SWW S1-10-2]
MNKNKIIGILGIGILISPLFPGASVQILIRKLLERGLFNTNLDVETSSIVAAYIGLIASFFVFKTALNYFANFDFEKQDQIVKGLKQAFFVSLSFFIIWFIIPFIDGSLGHNYMANLNQSYHKIDKAYLVFVVDFPIWFLGTASGVYLIYKKLTTEPNNKVYVWKK